jgi:hypothetical protein
MKKIEYLDDLEIVHKGESDDSITLDAMVEQGGNFERAYRLTTALDGVLTGSALEHNTLDSLMEEHGAEKEVFLDMLNVIFDIDEETLDSFADSKDDDFTDVLDVISETILDEFDEDVAPRAVSLFMNANNNTTLDGTFYPTMEDCKEGNSDNRPIHKGQTCKVTAHRGKLGFKRDGAVKGNPYKKTAQIGKPKKVADKARKVKEYIKSMKKLGYMTSKGKQSKAFKEAVYGSKSKSAKNRSRD